MKTIVLITIDTEFSTHLNDMGIFGRISDKEYGVPKLLSLLNHHGLKATFFIDVYTNKTAYLQDFQKLCLHLAEAGHDLQLHTHPNGLFDPHRGSMKDYTLPEQIEIIRKGKELFKTWFNTDPIAHRAGDWGANQDTLEALLANGISIDCSMFYGWPHCPLNELKMTRNRLVTYKGLLEMPASVFHCTGLGLFHPYRLLSTDGNPLQETLWILKNLQGTGINVITTVYHSFSFVKWNKERNNYKIDHNRIKKFDSFLRTLRQDNTIQVMTVAEFFDQYTKNGTDLMNEKDSVIRSGLWATARRLADRLQP